MKATSFTAFKTLRLFIWLTIALPMLYVLIYTLLSFCGQYRPMAIGDQRGWNIGPLWAPLGFYSSNPDLASSDPEKDRRWNYGMLKAFYCLWDIDIHYVHNRQTKIR
jgi:hypothetical protein